LRLRYRRIMAAESKPLLHPEILRQYVWWFSLPKRVAEWQPRQRFGVLGPGINRERLVLSTSREETKHKSFQGVMLCDRTLPKVYRPATLNV
jgi:hypothetical protein